MPLAGIDVLRPTSGGLHLVLDLLLPVRGSRHPLPLHRVLLCYCNSGSDCDSDCTGVTSSRIVNLGDC